MIKIYMLLAMANQFLVDRNWWQFHNPKNDALNILVEISELAELFINNDPDLVDKTRLADELADVLFGLCAFAVLTKIDLANSLGVLAGKNDVNNQSSDYRDLENLVLANLNKLGLNSQMKPTQTILSLVRQVGLLADPLIWCTTDESIVISTKKSAFMRSQVGKIMAHLIWLSKQLEIDLPVEFSRKMAKNNAKYPVEQASGSDYIAIKEQYRTS